MSDQATATHHGHGARHLPGPQPPRRGLGRARRAPTPRSASACRRRWPQARLPAAALVRGAGRRRRGPRASGCGWATSPRRWSSPAAASPSWSTAWSRPGLLERTFCETDRRVSYATLLPAGTRAARGDAPGRRRRARGRLLGQPQRRARRTSCATTSTRVRSTACTPAVASGKRRRGPLFGGLDQRQHSPSRALRAAAPTGSGSPLTIPSKNSLRSW